jgi:type IV secretory pathway VirJ component
MCGSEEKDSPCPELGHDPAESVLLPGGHHFGGKYDFIAGMILKSIAGE